MFLPIMRVDDILESKAQILHTRVAAKALVQSKLGLSILQHLSFEALQHAQAGLHPLLSLSGLYGRLAHSHPPPRPLS